MGNFAYFPELPTLVSPRHDWQRVSVCLESQHSGCVCYGTSGKRLAIPLESCKTATRHGCLQNPLNAKKAYHSLKKEQR